MLSKYVWDNIAQENYLDNIDPEPAAMILKEKNLQNFVLVCLDQDCMNNNLYNVETATRGIL